MWTINVTPAEFTDENLASLAVEIPRNLQSLTELGLLVSLWCGRAHDSCQVDGITIPFSFAFQEGQVVVEVEGGRLQSAGRLQIEAGRIKIAKSEAREAKREGKLGGALNFDLGSFFGLFGKGTSVDASGHVDKTVAKSEHSDGQFTQILWRLVEAGHNFWRVSGILQNSDNVLEFKVFGDEPLCFILAEATEISIRVSYRCNPKDLWISIPVPAGAAKRDMRFDIDSDSRNRAAIIQRILGRALTRGSGSRVFARQRIIATREGRDDP